MSAALAITPASGSITATKTVCKIAVTGADSNDAATFNDDNSPSEDAIPYVLTCSRSGSDDLVSVVFTPSADGKFQWDDLVFPHSGTWTATLSDTRTDSSVATLSVVVA